ncbi:hypothetical protein [Streptomyces sp. Wb2n-11]|nr:hypothetical protein [Streptomyces sp. Wb2n-11]
MAKTVAVLNHLGRGKQTGSRGKAGPAHESTPEAAPAPVAP